MSHLTNEQLLKQYQQGQLSAFEAFYYRNQSLIFNFLRMRLGNENDANDAFQETFFRIHKYIFHYDPTQKALAWVFSIAKNVAIDIQTKLSKTKEITDVEIDSISVVTHSQQARDELEEILKSLTEEERILLKTRFIDDDSYENMAKNFGISEANARQKVSRLVRKLKSLI